MKVLLIYNVTDRRCGFQNYGYQTDVALRRAGHDVRAWDGTYAALYPHRSEPYGGFFPLDIQRYDVVHIIWSAQTLNHYAGAPWNVVQEPILSWLDGGPSDASCPFKDQMPLKWGHYPRPAEEGYHVTPLPIPDWVTDLPEPDPVFTVGATSVRGDGIEEIRRVCAAQGWATNLPQPDQWLSLEDEVRRLARSTVNVCWYDTPPNWKDRAGAPSTALASHRPLLITNDSLLQTLWPYRDVYHGLIGGAGLHACLALIGDDWSAGTLTYPAQVLDDLSWSRAAAHFTRVWQEAIDAR